MWDAASGEQLYTFETYTLIRSREDPLYKRMVTLGGIRGSDFTPDGKQLITGDTNGEMQLWDVQTGKELKHYDQVGLVRSLEISPEGERVLINSLGFNGIMDVASGKRIEDIGFFSVVTKDWSKMLIPSSLETGFRVIDLKTEETIKMISYDEVGFPGKVFSLSPDGNFMVTGSYLGNDGIKQRRVIDLVNRNRVYKFQYDTATKDAPYAEDKFIEFFPQGKRFLTVNGNTLNIWDISDLLSYTPGALDYLTASGK
jgi:WD40 repeat protein